ncbi:MAG TPA: class II fructose-bisphosphate aldolase [Acidimicrobiales bacterium]
MIATPEQYGRMLDRAKAGGFAYPAVNVTSTQTLNAALRGFTEAGSDGIVSVSVGGAEYLSGAGVRDAVTGAVALAEVARVLAANHPGLVALHTDHCPPGRVDDVLRPLLAASQARVAGGGEPLFQSHMWDGSSLPLAENLRLAAELLEGCRRAHAVLEIEIGVVGGEEDGITGAIDERLYSTPEDALRVADALGLGERGRFLLAATFGNVHGVYQPGHVVLRPDVLREIQEAVGARHGRERPFDLVFHGGSGSSLADIQAAVGHGVVKMNVDTDAQYAFTRPIADHVLTRYDGVLRVDGGTGDKAAYDPRAWGRAAEASMADRVAEACRVLGSAGRAGPWAGAGDRKAGRP